jgi:hypothetical protein
MDADSSTEPRDAVPAVGLDEISQEALKSWATAPMAAGVAVALLQVCPGQARQERETCRLLGVGERRRVAGRC